MLDALVLMVRRESKTQKETRNENTVVRHGTFIIKLEIRKRGGPERASRDNSWSKLTTKARKDKQRDVNNEAMETRGVHRTKPLIG